LIDLQSNVHVITVEERQRAAAIQNAGALSDDLPLAAASVFCPAWSAKSPATKQTGNTGNTETVDALSDDKSAGRGVKARYM
jgi:hypothetical protein